MAHIQWYPGHIAKAEKKLKEQLNLVDVVIEIIDARIPLSSKYLNLEKLMGNKPRLLILNKADLADSRYSDEWKRYWQEKTGSKVILTSANTKKDMSSIISSAVELGQEKIEKIVAKGLLPRPIRAIVVGMPNVGKSSIINKLIKKSKVKTGAKAGVTRQNQWVRINPKIELLDTPGIIPMKLDNQTFATRLAMVNSVSENAYDKLEVAQDILNETFKLYKNEILENYKLEQETAPTLEEIAIQRKWLRSGAVPDVLRCAAYVLSDFRNGRIGKLTLDRIDEIQN